MFGSIARGASKASSSIVRGSSRCVSTSSSLSQSRPHVHPASHSAANSSSHSTHATATVTKVTDAGEGNAQFNGLSETQLAQQVEKGNIRFFNIEKEIGDNEKGVAVRRLVVQNKTGTNIEKLPYQHYNYNEVQGVCCENVIGVVPIPVGVAGPILVDGKEYFLPMATTEGALVASTTRGAKALSLSGGVHTELIGDGMSRAPVLSVPSIKVGHEIMSYIEANLPVFQEMFSTTSRFARLQSINCYLAGRKLFLRFKCSTGDAMGMNMVGKGVEKTLNVITERWPGVNVISLSGNVCTDKKPSAINWLEGRGKSIVCEAVIKEQIVKDVLKTTTDAIVECSYSKNLIGSAIAGSIGGQNAHAANIVAAMFLATGQDPAQVVESSNCLTLLERASPDNGDLYMSITMPTVEVGTIGGGTQLSPQSAMLELLGVKGSIQGAPAKNSSQLARIIGSAVMAGELSLMAALSSGHLIKSHMALNRKHTAPNAPTAN